MITVTKPFLPPLKEYIALLEGVWNRHWITNNGPLVNELELKLKEYLDVPHALYLANGTLALQIAIKALEIKGEVITTPFSYVATTSSIVWEGCTPVFVDIDPYSFNIDTSKIENAVTDKTSAIMATHVYGNPCDIDAIQEIAEKHNLKVIYDASHCFGTKYKNRSVYGFGDISTASFHATKLFHTVEGGAVFTEHSEILKRMSFLRNFGHDGYEEFQGLGINAKSSEFHAAMGLLMLTYVGDHLVKRREQWEFYKSLLGKFIFNEMRIDGVVDYNYAYFPLVLQSEEILIGVVRELERHSIFPRRYFFPSLNKLPYVKPVSMPVAEDLSRRVICLPLFEGLTKEEIRLIARIIARVINNQ